MMAAFVLDDIPMNAAFQSALSTDIVAEHPELWFRVRFLIIMDPICYELRVISTATGTSMKCYSPKYFPIFKASLKISFSRIMHSPHIVKTVRDFCSGQHIQLHPWPANSPDMLPIEHVWDLVGGSPS
ncbi:uncharacterized protein TNCV_685341 [Trichonephila clavipes]|nr:uncharacterized protein TNCV_685341 [Trichonephila clavipes]